MKRNIERKIEEMKNEIVKLNIEDLGEIIATEPLIAGKQNVYGYSKKQRAELKEKLIEIARKVIDLSLLEEKFLRENMNKCEKTKIINIEGKDKKEIKELLKKNLDKEIFDLLEDLI